MILSALLMSLALSAPARAAGVGAVTDLTWGISRTDIDRTVTELQRNGVGTVRMNANWAMLEPSAKGTLDAAALANLDYAVDRVRGAGIEILMPIADGVPYWASADPQKTTISGIRRWNNLWRPARFSDYADYVRTLVERYSQRGVHAYEVWNEPNLAHFWPSGVNAAEYVEMLRAAAPAIRAADPSAKVVLGGLSRGDYPYLEKLYAAGAAPYFDIAAVHPYSGAVDPTTCWNQSGTTRKALDAFCSIEEVRASMVTAGDGATPLWITEFGWSTTIGSYGVTESQQADYLTKAFQKLAGYSYVAKAFWYSFRNTYWLQDDPAQWEANAGLMRTDFTPKPALTAMAAYAMTQAAPAPASSSPPPAPSPAPAPAPVPAPTPNGAPTVTLTAPTEGQTFSSKLAFAAEAADDLAVARVEFLFDGRVVGSDQTAPYQLSWAVPKKERLGGHSVTARAVDAEGLSAPASASVIRVSSTSTTLTVRSASAVASPAVAVSSRRVVGRVRGGVRIRTRISLKVSRRTRRASGWHAVRAPRLVLDREGRFAGRLSVRRGSTYRVQASFAGDRRLLASTSRIVRIGSV
ncbi:MAG: Ig-like domain-containing protein [Egibacteraceae bacterium]